LYDSSKNNLFQSLRIFFSSFLFFGVNQKSRQHTHTQSTQDGLFLSLYGFCITGNSNIYILKR